MSSYSVRVKEVDVGNITMNQLYDLFCKYTKNERGRHMMVHKVRADYGNVGAVFFTLMGSPPKGYALYTFGSIIIYNSAGDPVARLFGHITDLDHWADFDLYIPLKERGRGISALMIGVENWE